MCVCPRGWPQWPFMSADLVIHLGLGHPGKYAWCPRSRADVSESECQNVNIASSSWHYCYLFLHSLPSVSLLSCLQYIRTHTPFSNALTQLFGSIFSTGVWEQENKSQHWCQIPGHWQGQVATFTQHLPRRWLKQLFFPHSPESKCIPFSTFKFLGLFLFSILYRSF